jgi:hypothetical protein
MKIMQKELEMFVFLRSIWYTFGICNYFFMTKIFLVILLFASCYSNSFADTVVYGKDGTSIWTKDAKWTFKSDGSPAGDRAALNDFQKNSWLYNGTNNPKSSTTAWTNTSSPVDPNQSQAETNRLNSTSPSNTKSKSVDCKTDANNSECNNILWVSSGMLRNGEVDMDTIPLVIVKIIETLLAIAGTVAIFSLIYHSVQMQINSGITGDSSGVDKAKKWMIGALIGFVIAISAWFLVTQAVSLLGAVT